MKNLNKTFLVIIIIALIGIFLVVGLVILLTSAPLPQSQNKTSSAPQLVSAIGPIVTIVSIATTVLFYFKKQEDEKIAVKTRTILALTEEIKENRYILRGFTKVEYPVLANKNLQHSIPNGEIRYTDAYLDVEVYHSILQTEFTFLSPKTQRRLSLLYSRIRSRNELLSYVDHFQDLFFTINEESESNYSRWYKNVERYDITLTMREQEILRLLDKVENSLRSELYNK